MNILNGLTQTLDNHQLTILMIRSRLSFGLVHLKAWCCDTRSLLQTLFRWSVRVLLPIAQPTHARHVGFDHLQLQPLLRGVALPQVIDVPTNNHASLCKAMLRYSFADVRRSLCTVSGYRRGTEGMAAMGGCGRLGVGNFQITTCFFQVCSHTVR